MAKIGRGDEDDERMRRVEYETQVCIDGRRPLGHISSESRDHSCSPSAVRLDSSLVEKFVSKRFHFRDCC